MLDVSHHAYRSLRAGLERTFWASSLNTQFRHLLTMNKKILAISMAVTLTASLLMVPVFNAQAQVTSESRVLATILSLTEQAKSKINNNIIPTVDTVQEDLKFKQKFFQYEPAAGPNDENRKHWFVVNATEIQIEVVFCDFPDQSACAFNVESIQFSAQGAHINAIEIDSDFTSTLDEDTPTNLLVDSGIGKVGASEEVSIFFDIPYTGPVEFNGEKPQGMILCTEDRNGEGPISEKSPHPCREGPPV